MELGDQMQCTEWRTSWSAGCKHIDEFYLHSREACGISRWGCPVGRWICIFGAQEIEMQRPLAYRQIIFRVLFQYRFHLDGWWSVRILVALQFRQVTKCKSLSRGMILWCCVLGILLTAHFLGKQLKQILYTLQFLICFQRIMHIVIEDIPSKNKP